MAVVFPPFLFLVWCHFLGGMEDEKKESRGKGEGEGERGSRVIPPRAAGTPGATGGG